MPSMSSWKRRNEAYKVLKGCHFRKSLKPKKPKDKTKPKSKGCNPKFDPNKKAKDYRTWKSCSRKVRYPSQGAASSTLHRWESHNGTKGRVYYCDICGGWHITVKHK